MNYVLLLSILEEIEAMSETAMRILVVDDEPMIGDLVEGMLMSLGYYVKKANCGAMALGMISTDQFDLVITDYLMPEMRGDELSSALKADFPELPVVMITGMCDTLEEHHGVDSLLAKPFTRDALLSVVEGVLGRTRA
jgi:CheY-like chemotaxis protein